MTNIAHIVIAKGLLMLANLLASLARLRELVSDLKSDNERTHADLAAARARIADLEAAAVDLSSAESAVNEIVAMLAPVPVEPIAAE